ncbi:MAG: type II secretion system GspH family protein [Bacillaceae bacterium]|nr:type II secretion system GspH family protein [Bacillaceae bacterium]
MKNYNGFSLIEVITSLLVLVIVITVLIPIITKVYVERGSIRQEQDAIYFINEIILDWLENIPIESQVIESNGTSYFIRLDSMNEKAITVCLEWDAINTRKYERCEQAKKK